MLQYGRKRLEMKSPVHDQLGSRDPRRQVKLLPDTLSLVREDRLCFSAIAVQVLRYFKNAPQVGASALVFPSFSFCLAQRLPNTVFDQDHFFPVRLVLWRS